MQTPPLNKTVLIIEDEISILKGIADKFTFSGFNVLTARDGEEGLKEALKSHPDIILLDHRMPKMDGLTMVEKLREDPWGKTAKVSIWSNSHSPKTLEGAARLDVVDFLIKSEWEYNEVVKKVKHALGIGEPQAA